MTELAQLYQVVVNIRAGNPITGPASTREQATADLGKIREARESREFGGRQVSGVDWLSVNGAEVQSAHITDA